MKLDAYASAFHYFAHLEPIWEALPAEHRGTFYVTGRIPPSDLSLHHGRPRGSGPIMVASYGDYRQAAGRPVVFVEHGAGQTYSGISVEYQPAYSGGPGRQRTILFICPSDAVAERNRARYPRIPAVAVGSPILDRYHPPMPKPRSDPPTVGLAWHADYRFVPEVSSGFRHFWPAARLLQDAGYQLLGHGHPRLYRRLERLYQRAGIEATPDAREVLGRCDVLCVDNSSIGCEFASLDRPIVWLSPPAYRRDVHHGGRFWDWLGLGTHAANPDEVPSCVEAALGLDMSAPERGDLLATIYSYRDGRAAERAVVAILEHLGARTGV